MAEEAADDEALYDVWRRLTAQQVDAIENLLDRLALRRARGGRATAEDIDNATELRDGPLGLGFLPIVADVLSNSLMGPSGP